MSEPHTTKPVPDAAHFQQRDGETYIALGIFIDAVGLPVLIGTYWAYQTSVRAAIVNGVCGMVLVLVGVAAMLYGRLLLARSKKKM
ncbi:MAG: hypothetical protein HY706_05330 [Candidatus Hydrogenedentes bacterium]|nr:hypothetical protein [Candidatus Hydrogenedentota bacterium]